VTAPTPLVTAVRTAKQFLTFVSSGPFQYAIAGALALPDSYYEGFTESHVTRRDRLAAGLAEAGFEVFPPDGTYFITTDITSLGEKDGLEFCRSLPGRCGVVAVPNVVFYDNVEAGRSQVRFAFCKKPSVLEEAVSRLARLRGA